MAPEEWEPVPVVGEAEAVRAGVGARADELSGEGGAAWTRQERIRCSCTGVR